MDTIYSDYQDEEGSEHVGIYFISPGEITPAENEMRGDALVRFLDDNLPLEHCQHQGDCCGHMYRKSREVLTLCNEGVIVRTESYRNA